MSFQVYQAQGLRIFSGDTVTCAGYTGNAGEISVNTETKAVYVHDGFTAGGTPLTTASEAEMLGMTLGQLANVYLESQSDKSLLSFDLNSDSWKSIEGLKVSDLLDMAVTTPSEGDLLAYDGATQKWKNVPASTGGAGATNLTGLDDVNLVSPANDQVLSYNSSTSKWENKAAPAGGGSGGSGLPKIDSADYKVTTGGEIDLETDPNNEYYADCGFFYGNTGITYPDFNDKIPLGDYEPDNTDTLMLTWDFQRQVWKIIKGSDLAVRKYVDNQFLKKTQAYTKAETDSKITASIEASAASAASDSDDTGVPIGSIAIWPKVTDSHISELPTGWVPCNGTYLLQKDYPELFDEVKYVFSGGKMVNGSGDIIMDEYECKSYQESLPENQRTFFIPDYRNQILIGSDGSNLSAFWNHPDLQPENPDYWKAGTNNELSTRMKLTWNDTLVDGPSYLDMSQPWIYGPYGNQVPIMPDGRNALYIMKAK